ncbi:MAG: hypothetical protein DRQ78_04450 [Epsilonproteobacteria bacterium]|nr:MAG: hypothetical protein DRQ78_04450 [Campylobacterota bacterium]
MKKTILLFILLHTFGYADTIGGEVSLGVFNHSPSGQVSYVLPPGNIGTSSDLEDTLGFSETQDIFFKAYLEHPLLFLPNIKLGYTKLSHEGSNDVNLFSWGDIHQFTGNIDNSLALDISDATLYYEALDNWLEVDLGLTLRYLSGNIAVNTSAETEVIDFSTLFPMLYAKGRFNIPSTDVAVQMEANAISYGGLTSYDYEISARYTLTMGLGLEAGYKSLHLDSDELSDGLDANVDFSGPFVSAIWDF